MKMIPVLNDRFFYFIYRYILISIHICIRRILLACRICDKLGLLILENILYNIMDIWVWKWCDMWCVCFVWTELGCDEWLVHNTIIIPFVQLRECCKINWIALLIWDISRFYVIMSYHLYCNNNNTTNYCNKSALKTHSLRRLNQPQPPTII